jgi:hypothetical protein
VAFDADAGVSESLSDVSCAMSNEEFTNTAMTNKTIDARLMFIRLRQKTLNKAGMLRSARAEIGLYSVDRRFKTVRTRHENVPENPVHIGAADRVEF